MKVTITNAHVAVLATWLNELLLEGRRSRERTRFVKKLGERYDENEKFRKEILAKYSKKDEKGEQVLTKDRKNVELEKGKEEAFGKELQELYDEVYEVTLDDVAGKMIKDLVLNTNYVFGPMPGDDEVTKMLKVRQANDYNVWCEMFEAAK